MFAAMDARREAFEMKDLRADNVSAQEQRCEEDNDVQVLQNLGYKQQLNVSAIKHQAPGHRLIMPA